MKTPYRFRLLALSFFMGTLFALAQSEDWAAESPLVTINNANGQSDSYSFYVETFNLL